MASVLHALLALAVLCVTVSQDYDEDDDIEEVPAQCCTHAVHNHQANPARHVRVICVHMHPYEWKRVHAHGFVDLHCTRMYAVRARARVVVVDVVVDRKSTV